MFGKIIRRLTGPSLRLVTKPAGPSGRLSGLRFGKTCRWQLEGQKNASFAQFRCATCGVEAYSRTGQPPKGCKKGLDGRL